MVESSTRGGRTAWTVVIVMILAFAVAGVGLIVVSWSPIGWVVLGIGAAIFVIAGLVGLATGIMEHVE